MSWFSWRAAALVAVSEVTVSAICLLPGGCGQSLQMNYDTVPLIAVSGVVTLDDLPLADAVITFESADTGTFSYGQTDSAGNYVLQFDSHQAGCLPGPKRVRISTARRIAGLNSEEDAELPVSPESAENGSGEVQSAEKVPTCYHQDSQLHVHVTESSAQLNFALKTDCTCRGPDE